MSDKTLIIRSRGTSPFAQIEASTLKLGDAETKVYRLRKEIIPLGESRKHPDKGYAIHVPRERADKWLKNFALMSERGHVVPAPPDHKDTKNSFGKWTSLSVEPNERGGESLYGVIQVAGQKNFEDVLNKDVSICTRAELSDDKGNTYDEAIDHISVTPFPALTNLSGWAPIAASRGQGDEEKAPVFELSATPTKEPEMNLTELRKSLGAAETVSDDDVLKQAIARVNAVKAAEASVVALTRERDEFKAKHETATLELSSRPAGKRLDKELAHERRLRVAEKISALRGTPDWTKRATDLLCGPKESPNDLMLARASDGADDVLAVDYVKLLADFKPSPEGGEKTGAQILELTNDRAEDPTKQKPITPERKNELLSMVGLPPVKVA